MSGGAYDYAYYQIEELAESILKKPQASYELAQEMGYEVDVNAHMAERRLVAEVLEEIGEICHAIEWIDSGDYGEDSWILVLGHLRAIRDRLNLSNLLKA